MDTKKKVLIGLGIVALLVGGYFVYKKVTANSDSDSEKKSDSTNKHTPTEGLTATTSDQKQTRHN